MKHIEQKLLNWGEWMRRREDNGLGYGESPISRLMGVSSRTDPSSMVPVDDIEASQTDTAVRSLPRHLQLFCNLWFAQQCSVRDVARRACCSTTTVSIRVEQVQQGVSAWFRARHELIETAKKRFSEKNSFVT